MSHIDNERQQAYFFYEGSDQYMKKYGKEEFIKVLKHLATYFEAYNCIGIEEMEPEKLDKIITRLRSIANRMIGVIDLSESTVKSLFILE